MGAFFYHTIGAPLYWVISGILVVWHKIFSFIPSSGWAWALAIVGLTATIRALLIPLMVKQIKAMRAMQLIQPQMKAIQDKYKHDRERMSQEMMKLYKDNGTNPFASCLPILVQMPIFFSLFALLRHAVSGKADFFLKAHVVDAAHPVGWTDATHAGGWTLADSFGTSSWLHTTLGSSLTNTHGHPSTQVIAPVLVILMTLTQFLTSRQILTKNMPPSAMEGSYARQQKIMMYALPVVFSLGSFGFPIGLMLYWTTSNLWTMGQQYVVIKASPTPGSPAAIAKEKRDREKAALKAGTSGSSAPVGELSADGPRPAARTQPKRQTKAQRQAKAPGQAGKKSSEK